jgi:cold shock CspA family protein
MNDRVNGYIDAWFEARGYGFAKIDNDPRRFFFHYTYAVSGKIREGAFVEFSIGKTSKGFVALDVVVVPAAQAGALSVGGAA